MAYIYKRRKYWWVGYKAGGRNLQKSLKVTVKEAAQTLLGEYQTIEARYHNRSKVLTVKKRIEDLTEEFAAGKAREKTRKWYRWCGTRFSDFCRGRGIDHVGDIHADTIEAFYTHLKKEARKKREDAEKKGRALKHRSDPGGAGSILRGVKALLNYAVRHGCLPENPARYIKPDKPTKKLFRDLSFAEIKKLLTSARGTPWYAVFATAYYAGLREGELIYLKPGDLNLKEGYLDVKSKSENQIKDHQERRIPLNSTLKKILKKHRPGLIWLFETEPGKPRRHNLNRALRQAAKRAGIKNRKDINMRVLRETFGSHLRRRGVDIALISQYMGHSSIDVTLRHYAHIPLEKTLDEIDRL